MEHHAVAIRIFPFRFVITLVLPFNKGKDKDCFHYVPILPWAKNIYPDKSSTFIIGLFSITSMGFVAACALHQLL
jgi:hypothetical protein